jgi:predicted ATPase/class 3 adenylate cyclase
MGAWRCGSCGGENPEGTAFCGHCGAAVGSATSVRSAGVDVTDALRSFVAGPVADRLIESGGTISEERRLVTALFADVSGFTSLAERLDPEELSEVIDPVVAALSSVVGHYEGYVEKFAGDALLALFGAPVAHEDDSARALAVALEMHTELARAARDLPHKPNLSLHVGVNSGHGIARILGSDARMDYGVLGDAVILAQRLESAAPPGETYVSETTVRLTEKRFEFEEVGLLALKGKSDPVPAWRLVRQRVRPRMSRRSADEVAPTFVGRPREIAVGRAFLDGAAAGSGGVLDITGEPGVGKSRLLEELRTEAARRQIEWLEMRCLSYGAAVPYWPYVELLRRLAGIRVEAKAQRNLRSLDSMLERYESGAGLPFFARLLGLAIGNQDSTVGLEPEAFRRGLHDAFGALFTGFAAASATLVVLEDVHWADPASVALTADLGLSVNSRGLAVVLTARPEGRSQLDAMTVRVLPEHCRSLSLEPLDDAAATALVESVLGGAASSELLRILREQTQGNPFFLEEITRSLKEQQIMTRRGREWTLPRGWSDASIPTSVEGALAARIDLLPRDASALLGSASVIGRRFRVSLLAAVDPLVTDRAAPLGQLVDRGFLDELPGDGERELTFHHVLVQEVAYNRLLRRQRRELHGRVAQAAESLYGAGDDVIDLLARHLYLSEAGPKAIDYSVRAADRAKSLYANEEAITHLEHVAEIMAGGEADDGLSTIQLEVADLRELIGDYEAAQALYETVRDTTDEARAWRGIASTLRKRGRYDEALEVLASATAVVDAGTLEVALERAWTLAAASRFPAAIETTEEALAGLTDGDEELRAQLLLLLTRAQTIEGRLDEAVANGSAAREIFERSGNVRGLATALRILGDAHRDRGEFDAARAVLLRGLEIAQRVGSVAEIGGCLINLGVVELRRGALAEAIAYDRRALDEFERVGDRPGSAIGYANLAEMLLYVGELDEALDVCGQGLKLARELGMGIVVADATQTTALILLERGQPEEAAARAEEAAELFTTLGAAPLAASALEVAVTAWESAGDSERAAAVAGRAPALSPDVPRSSPSLRSRR